LKHVTHNQVSSTGIPFISVALVFCKTNKDPSKGLGWSLDWLKKLIACSAQQYQLPPDPEHHEIDGYYHLSVWMDHLQSLLGRPLTTEDYIFPALAPTGLLKFGEAASHSGIEALLERVVQKSLVMNWQTGKFTTHCFRRGGAQYRFMWADCKWSLKAVKWWGGWSSSEKVCPFYISTICATKAAVGWHNHALSVGRAYCL
jgi:hypothetical protein